MTDNDCGCGCDTASAPPGVDNAPGLPALAYRVGTQTGFLADLQQAISAAPALRGLTTRELDDPSMALLDGAASLLDVLTFYTERIADEGYLRTATEFGSVQALAAEIGYLPSPGVAASTALAFTVDDIPGAPTSTQVPIGTRVQSVPGQDEQPQVFETVEAVEARNGWNRIAVRTTEPEVLVTGLATVHLAGTATGLRVGDRLLFVGAERIANAASDRWDVRRVASLAVQPDTDPAAAGVTVVGLDYALGSVAPASAPPGTPARVFALRDRAALFGHNAMPWRDLPLSLRVGELPPGGGTVITGPYASRQNTWADARLPIGSTQLDLDRTVPGIVPGSWIVLTAPGKTAERADAELFAVTGVTERSLADFLLTGKVTTLTVSGENISHFTRRTATVLCASDELRLAERPILTAVGGQRIELAAVTDLPTGRTIVVTGTPVGGSTASTEIAVVDAVSGSTVQLHEPLSTSYVRSTVALLGNVAEATHGETRTRLQPEILGSGDSRQAFQAFAVKASPITYRASASGSGAESTLTVRVDGIRWHEVPSLYQQPADARVYVVRRDDTGRVLVQFGDGITGARLPSGTNNVTADYRIGIGIGASLDPGRLSLLIDRPLGLSGVTNPVPAAGAADPESLDDARRNAPTTVLTLGRVVSLADYESFVRSFAGVGKASAVALWHAAPGQPLSAGEQRVVHVTVGTALGAPLGDTDPLADRIRTALDAARHPSRPVVLDGYRSLLFRTAVAVRTDPDLDSGVVLAAVESALSDNFSFAARDFAQGATMAEVLAVAQRVTGVLGATLDLLDTGTGRAVRDLPALPARVQNGVFQLADLLTVGDVSVRELS